MLNDEHISPVSGAPPEIPPQIPPRELSRAFAGQNAGQSPEASKLPREAARTDRSTHRKGPFYPKGLFRGHTRADLNSLVLPAPIGLSCSQEGLGRYQMSPSRPALHPPSQPGQSTRERSAILAGGRRTGLLLPVLPWQAGKVVAMK